MSSKGQFKIPACDLNNIFSQVEDVCWIQSTSAAFFLSDGGRKTLWPQIFKFNKINKTDVEEQSILGKLFFNPKQHITELYVPTCLKTFNNNDIKNRYVVLYEMIRTSIEISYERMVGKTVKSSSPIKIEDIGLHRDATMRGCDIGMQEMMYIIDDEWTDEDGGGYIGKIARFMAANYEGINLRSVRNKVDIDNIKPNDYDVLMIGYDEHAVSIFKCNDKWIHFDNEGLSNTVHRHNFISLSVNASTETLKDLISGLPNTDINYDTIDGVYCLNFTGYTKPFELNFNNDSSKIKKFYSTLSETAKIYLSGYAKPSIIPHLYDLFKSDERVDTLENLITLNPATYRI